MNARLIRPLAALTAAASLAGGAAYAAPAATQAVPALTSSEVAALTYMREEEKLARDVYTALAAKWNVPVFRNIARSEQTHMAAVKVLLDRYGIADPAAGRAAGSFANATLQALYDRLVKDGSASLAAAAAVGVQIEKLDIADLATRLSQTAHADVKLVFTRLSQASQSHLRAFQRFA